MLAACVVDPELEEFGLDELEQASSGTCYGCGTNGNPQSSWNNTFSQMDRNALDAHGAWDWGGDAPTSVCRPATVTATGCEMRWTWSNWLHAGTSVRVQIMTNLAKLIAPKGFRIQDPAGTAYGGMFDIAPEARASSWGYAGQEYISAGLLALLNSVEGVPVCLQTERKPDACVGSGAGYHESTTFGQVLRGSRFAAIAGGSAAPDPTKNLRYGTVWQGSATSYVHSLTRCPISGSGETRHATYCDADTMRWQHPVVVLTPGAPSTWYYDVGSTPLAKPASFEKDY